MSQIATADETVYSTAKAELIEAQIRLLSDHRKLLLQNIHADQRQRDCLDFLLYKIRHSSI